MKKQIDRKRFLKEEGGVAMVEFALLLIMLLLILLGVIQFGLMWYTKYVITCASREGARYATRYASTVNAQGNQTRIPPCNLNPSVESTVQNYCNSLLNNTPVTFTPSNNTGWQTGNAGTDVTIQVSCQNPWDLLGGFIPALHNLTFQAQTTMKCE